MNARQTRQYKPVAAILSLLTCFIFAVLILALPGCSKPAHEIVGASNRGEPVGKDSTNGNWWVTWSLTTDDGKSYLLEFDKKCKFGKKITLRVDGQLGWSLLEGQRYRAQGDKICSLKEAGIKTCVTNDTRQVLIVTYIEHSTK